MYLLYSAALAVAAALSFPYFLFQGLRHGKYLRSFSGRWGRVDVQGGAGPIWLHAVSVGEVLASVGLLAELRKRLPGRKLLVSTTTETGFRTAQEKLDADGFFYCPFDFAFAVRRVLRKVKPSMVVMAETELWPNLFREARVSGARLAVVNARISDRSFPRYRRFRFFFRRVLDCADLFLAQSEEDARRLREMGAPEGRTRVTGTIKYDLHEPAPLPARLDAEIKRWSAPGVLVAGSTAAGEKQSEEEVVLEAFRRLRLRRPALRLILAPRRPERFDLVAVMVRERGFTVDRRSENPALNADVLLLDTMGELASFYRYASVAFVGGSLVPHGGQNPLEAAWFARPIVVGPSMSNFREITAALVSAGALRQVQSADELPAALDELLAEPVAARQMGERARAVLEANRGATARTAEALATLLTGERVWA